MFRHIKCAPFLSKLAHAAFDSEPLARQTFPRALPVSAAPHTVRPLTKYPTPLPLPGHTGTGESSRQVVAFT